MNLYQGLIVRSPIVFSIALLLLASTALSIPIVKSIDPTDEAQYIKPIIKEIKPLGTVMFQPEPTGRGTWGILFSCTVTLIFCVWTAIHPNVFLAHHGGLRTFYKIIWMVFAIGQPEAILLVALGQLREARMVREEWRKKFALGKYNPERARERNMFKRWWKSFRGKFSEGDLAMSEAFFVVMGGFVIDETTEPIHAEPELRTSPTMQPPTPYKHLDSIVRKLFKKRSLNKEEPERPSSSSALTKHLNSIVHKAIHWFKNGSLEEAEKERPSSSSALIEQPPTSDSSAASSTYHTTSIDTASDGEGTQVTVSGSDETNTGNGRLAEVSTAANLNRPGGSKDEKQSQLVNCDLRIPTQAQNPANLEPYLATLTPVGFVRYLKEGGIDRGTFRTADIEDKGKADGLKKLISGSQALWFLVQITLRYASHLPITLLEIHLFIQVICSFAIYFCWWSKPLDIAEPLRITIKTRVPVRESARTALNTPPSIDSDCSSAIGCEGSEDRGMPPMQQKPDAESGASSSRSLFSSDQAMLKDLKPLHDRETGKQLSANDLIRLKQDRRLPRNRPYIVKQATPNRPSTMGRALFDIATYLEMTTQLEEDPMDSGDERERLPGPKKGKRANGVEFGILFEVVLVLAIGLLHVLAWNSHFPSEMEKYFWRAASLGLCFFSLVVVAITAFSNFHDFLMEATWNFTENNAPILNILDFPRLWREILTLACSKQENYYDLTLVRRRPTLPEFSVRNGIKFMAFARFAGRLTLVLLCIFSILCYSLCTTYLTVESYIGLRNVPLETFRTPSISDYWPHL